MKYAVVYCSHTGNTKRVAEAIAQVIPAEDMLYFGIPDMDATKDADVIFAGFWTDKGSCPSALLDYPCIINKSCYSVHVALAAVQNTMI